MSEKPETAVDNRTAIIAHIAPFAAWIALLEVLPKEAWGYAVRTAVTLGLLIALRPWRWYSLPQGKDILLGFLVGVGVFAIWVLPEIAWMERFGWFGKLYRTVGMLAPWKETVVEPSMQYAPENCGWLLTVVRLAGSAFVIAAAEEFFWRGFLYRWLVKKDFVKLDMGTMDIPMFLFVALFFGLEHDRWLVGAVAGLAYGLLAVRTRNLGAAVVAHVVTNLLLGLYVVATGAYSFW